MTASLSVSHLKWHFLLTFVTLPLALAWIKPHGVIYSILWILTLIGLWVLRKYHGYRFREDWNFAALDRTAIRFIVLRFLPFALFLLLFAGWMIPERMFTLPLERPLRWIIVMIWYPLLSVFPQELLFRSFFFRHYAPWLRSPKLMVFVNAFAFGWVHIVLHNWVAVAFSFVGGLLFADTYRRTRSLAAVCFEHALYGCFIFTIGLGWYFYHGLAVR
jgi:uncharacterized protein